MSETAQRERTVPLEGLKAAEQNVRWLAQHPEVTQAHRGEWICIVDEVVVVAERDWKTFSRRVKRYDDRDGNYILRIPTPEDLDVAHPW